MIFVDVICVIPNGSLQTSCTYLINVTNMQLCDNAVLVEGTAVKKIWLPSCRRFPVYVWMQVRRGDSGPCLILCHPSQKVTQSWWCRMLWAPMSILGTKIHSPSLFSSINLIVTLLSIIQGNNHSLHLHLCLPFSLNTQQEACAQNKLFRSFSSPASNMLKETSSSTKHEKELFTK